VRSIEDIRDTGAAWVTEPELAMLCAFAKRAEQSEMALAEWRKHDSAPDCVACAVLDAATCGALRVEDK